MGPPPLQDQTALVTGAAKRLGRAIALAVAEAGADVCVHYRSSGDDAERLVSEITGLGRRAVRLQADLEDPEQTETLFDRAIEEAGPVSLLVNNASIFPASRLADLDRAHLARNIEVNAFAPLVLARALARQEREGCVINLLDCRIADHDSEHAGYHLSKVLLARLTRMLALELAPRVRVNGVAPGLILPPPGADETYLERMKHTNPLARHGEAADVAHAALYLARSPFVTGQILFVDGGRHLLGEAAGT